MQSNYYNRQTPSLSVISESQIDEFIQAGFTILERTGVKITHPEAIKLLIDAGAVVKNDIAKVPRNIVQKALDLVPKGINIYSRDGQPAMQLSGSHVYYGTSTASPNNIDIETLERRPTTIQDITNAGIIADALPNIDFVMPFGTAQDVPAIAGDVHEFVALMSVTAKPMVFCGYSATGVKKVLEMAAYVAGGIDKLREAPFIIPYPEPITPLHFPDETVGRMLVTAEMGIPQVNSGGQSNGQNSPVTMAGGLALAMAESFFAITLNQLKRPGAPCFLTSSVVDANHRTGCPTHGNPSPSITLAAQAQIGRRLGLPIWGLAGITDSKVVDAQAGAEGALHIMMQALAGANLIHDVGYMEAGMVCSAGMLVLGDEIINWVKHVMKGLEVSAETLALEALHQVGPGGNFLGHKHTVKHFRNESWFPSLFNRDQYEGWVKAGSLDCADAAYAKARKILSTHKPNALSDSMIDDLKRMAKEAEKELLSQ